VRERVKKEKGLREKIVGLIWSIIMMVVAMKTREGKRRESGKTSTNERKRLKKVEEKNVKFVCGYRECTSLYT